jgi:hypothetical protein
MGDSKKIMSMFDKVSEVMGTYQQSDKSLKAIELFQQQVEILTEPLPSQRNIIRSKEFKAKSFAISGAMMMFLYDPIGEQKLPYYDRFPLVIPIKRGRSEQERNTAGAASKSFLGLNMHYLDYYDRARLLDMIQVLGSPKSIRLNRISYDLLAQIRRYRSFRACLRVYRMDRVITNIALIPRDLWETVLFLPIEDFRTRRAANYIWKDSKKIYRAKPGKKRHE